MTFLRNPRVQFWTALLLPVIAVLIAYAPIYNGPFIWDDNVFLLEWDLLHDLTNTPHILSGALPPGHKGGYRPLRTMYEALSYRVFGENPSPYHIQAVLFHIVSTSVVFLLLHQLFVLFNVKLYSERRTKILLATLGACIFGLHPVMQASVAFIQGSFDMMGITFAFISYILFLYWYRNSRHVFLFSSWGFALISFLFYELAYPLPLLIIVTSFLFGLKRKKIFTFVFPYILLLSFVFLLRLAIFHIPSGRPSVSPSLGYELLGNIYSLALYIWQTLFPIDLAGIHEVAPGISAIRVYKSAYYQLRIISIQTVFAAASLTVAGLSVIKYAKKLPLLALGISWFFISLFPIVNPFIFGGVYSERYLYLPILGFSLICIVCISQISEHLKSPYQKLFLLTACIIMISFTYGTRTFFRILAWTNPIRFWSKEVQRLPNYGRLHNFLAEAYEKNGQYDQASDEYLLAIEYEDAGTKHIYYKNLSRLFFVQKKYLQARSYAEMAVTLEPSSEENVKILLTINKTIHDPKHEVQFYSALIQKKISEPWVYVSLGNASIELGNYMDAESAFQKAIELNPELKGKLKFPTDN